MTTTATPVKFCSECGGVMVAIWESHRTGEAQQPPKYHCINGHCQKFNQEIA